MKREQPTFTPNWSWLMRNKTAFIGFGFGSGLATKAPGTFGSLVGMMLAGLLLGSGMSHFGLFVFSLILFLGGIWICSETELALGGVHDYKGIVWDEIVAMLLVFSLVPQGVFWWWFAFALFRFFDIVKPQPIQWAEQRYARGFGVMVDDMIAALYTVLSLQLINLFI